MTVGELPADKPYKMHGWQYGVTAGSGVYAWSIPFETHDNADAGMLDWLGQGNAHNNFAPSIAAYAWLRIV